MRQNNLIRESHSLLQLKNYQLMGLVMVVEAEKIPIFRQQLKSLINES